MNGDARARIFREARTAFAASGYDGASLRSITRAAGVDVALVAYYFGNKDGLFREVMASACVRGDEIFAALEDARPDAGAEVTRLISEVLASDPCRQVLEANFRTALSPNHDEDAMHLEVVEQLRIMYARAVGGPDSHPGNHLFAALFTGMLVMRHLLPVEPLASVKLEQLKRVLAVQAQEILDAVDDRGDHAGWGTLSDDTGDAVVEPAPLDDATVVGGVAAEDEATTKARILDAARRSFASVGYHGSALRDLASEVGCNVALIPYHYGNKLGLFEAVVGQGLQGAQEIRAAMDVRDQDLGSPEANQRAAAASARYIVEMFTKEPSATALRAIILSAASPRDEHAKMHADLMRMVQTSFDEAIGSGPHLTAQVEQMTEEEQADLRLAYQLFGAIPVGIFVLRSILHLEPLAKLPEDDLVGLLSPRLDWLLNGKFTAAVRQSREVGPAV